MADKILLILVCLVPFCLLFFLAKGKTRLSGLLQLVTVLTLLLTTGCNSQTESTVSSSIVVSLDKTHNLKIVSTSSGNKNENFVQTLSFFERDIQIESIKLNDVEFLNSNSKVSEVAKVSVSGKWFYMIYITSGNGEPEYYLLYTGLGELAAYECCSRRDCMVITCIPEKALNFEAYFKNDTVPAAFINVP